MGLSRRTLLTTAGAVTAGAALTAVAPGVRVAFNKLGFGAPAQRDILVVVFLRFGSDGLTMIAPADEANYRDARPTIAVADRKSVV